MKVRKMRPEEEEIVVRMERKAIYPELSLKKMQQWIDGEAIYNPLTFVLENKGEIIGGVRWEIQDYLDETRIILHLDGLFIEEKWRKQRLGRRLLLESLDAAKLYYQNQGLKVMGLLIQTTEEAARFYQKIFSSGAGFSCTSAILQMDETRIIIVFLVFLTE